MSKINFQLSSFNTALYWAIKKTCNEVLDMFQVLFCVFLKRFTRIWNKLLFALVVLNICLEIRVYVLSVWAWKVSKFIAEDLIWVRSGGVPGWAEKRRNYEHHTLCWKLKLGRCGGGGVAWKIDIPASNEPTFFWTCRTL